MVPDIARAVLDMKFNQYHEFVAVNIMENAKLLFERVPITDASIIIAFLVKIGEMIPVPVGLPNEFRYLYDICLVLVNGYPTQLLDPNMEIPLHNMFTQKKQFIHLIIAIVVKLSSTYPKYMVLLMDTELAAIEEHMSFQRSLAVRILKYNHRLFFTTRYAMEYPIMCIGLFLEYVRRIDDEAIEVPNIADLYTFFISVRMKAFYDKWMPSYLRVDRNQALMEVTERNRHKQSLATLFTSVTQLQQTHASVRLQKDHPLI